MVLGFTTSSTNAFPAIQMVSKVGSGAVSGFVLVKQSTTSRQELLLQPVPLGRLRRRHTGPGGEPRRNQRDRSG